MLFFLKLICHSFYLKKKSKILAFYFNKKCKISYKKIEKQPTLGLFDFYFLKLFFKTCFKNTENVFFFLLFKNCF